MALAGCVAVLGIAAVGVMSDSLSVSAFLG